MPFLGQLGRSHPYDAGFRRRSLTSVLDPFLRRHWPVVWAFGLLLGFQVGLASDVLPAAVPLVPPWWLVRAAAGTVLLLAVRRFQPGAALALLVLLAVSGGTGFREQIRISGLRTAEPAWVHLPAEHWSGTAAVRVTGWASELKEGRRQFPAVLLERGVELDRVGRFPRRGEGMLLQAEGAEPAPGTILAVRLELRPPGRRAMPGGFSDYRYLLGKGLAWRGRITERHVLSQGRSPLHRGLVALDRLKWGILQALDARLPAPEAALSGAVLLGRKSPLARRGSEPFVDLGLGHLFALSGLHVGILAGIVLLPPAFMGSDAAGRMTWLGPTLLLYGLLTGAPGSVVRAAALLVLSQAGAVWGRRGDPLFHLGILYLVLGAGDPRQLLDAGCSLSYLAAGGILAVGPALQELQRKLPGPVGWAAAGAGVSLAAQWFTLPVVAGSFGRINAWSLVANLLVVPYFALVVWSTVLVLLSGWWPWAMEALSALAVAGWRALLVTVGPVADRAQAGLIPLMPPGVSGWMVWLAVTLLVAIRARHRRFPRNMAVTALLAGALLGVPGFLALHGRDLRPRHAPVAWQVDVGQGDCAILAFPDGWRCIIDTGGRFGFGPGGGALWDRTLGPYLRRQGIGAVDLVVLTHGHLDHTGGAAALAAGVGVGRWLCGGRAAPPDGRVPAPVREDSVLHRWGDWDLVLQQGPASGERDLSENDHSLLLALRRRGRAMMLWGGDMEREAEARFVKTHPGFTGAQVWKAGHHGSDTSGTAAFVDLIRPQLVLISCGAGNRYLHPRHGPYIAAQDTLPLLRTDCAGSIRLAWDVAGGLKWRTLFGESGSLDPP